jgi:hypothetical protein
MYILKATLDFLFGCHHNNLSRVFTLEGQSYRVCCDCGRRFKYSLANMSIEGRHTLKLSVERHPRRMNCNVPRGLCSASSMEARS